MTERPLAFIRLADRYMCDLNLLTAVTEWPIQGDVNLLDRSVSGGTQRKRIYLSPPHVGDAERRLLLEAFDSNWIAPLGPHVDGFEREICERLGVGHAAALSSGTAAIHLALVILGVESGDEVVTSTLTFSATVNAITYCGARPVLIDASPETWCMDEALLAEELAAARAAGRRVKAVLPVDLYGQCPDYGRIRQLCDEYELPLLEDAAEALGATCGDHPAGSLGDLGVLSFNGNKIITTSGGGMLVSQREDWIQRARYLATQARDPAPHYQHSTIGYNYRMSNLLAAVGRGQLRSLDDKVQARRATNRFYREALADEPGITFMPEPPHCSSNAWLTCILIEPAAFGATREHVRQHLETFNIESRPVWKPMHLQPVFRGCRYRGRGTSDFLFEQGLCLPSGSSLTEEERGVVVDALRSTLREAR